MTHEIKFNTGRYYTKEGQVIYAKFTKSDEGPYNSILFADVSRQIYGAIVISYSRVIPKDRELEEIVMFNYDRGLYYSGVDCYNYFWEKMSEHRQTSESGDST